VLVGGDFEYTPTCSESSVSVPVVKTGTTTLIDSLLFPVTIAASIAFADVTAPLADVGANLS